MKKKCLYCEKEFNAERSKIKYCSITCQLKYEYKTGKRDRVKTGEKARAVAHKKLKENNWLNTKTSRENLKKSLNKPETRLKLRNSKLGDKNPMFNKQSPNYIEGTYRRNGTADRGFDWKNIRLKIKQRDKNKCRHCGTKEKDLKQPLQVHHIVPYRVNLDNSPENLITLCSSCHSKAEPKFFKITSITKKKGSERVYNFSVDEDESYVANDLVVHNCRSTIVAVF